MLEVAAALRERAAATDGAERADLIFLAEEYEATASGKHPDKAGEFSVKLPR